MTWKGGAKRKGEDKGRAVRNTVIGGSTPRKLNSWGNGDMEKSRPDRLEENQCCYIPWKQLQEES